MVPCAKEFAADFGSFISKLTELLHKLLVLVELFEILNRHLVNAQSFGLLAMLVITPERRPSSSAAAYKVASQFH